MAKQRLFYIDNLRIFLISLVVLQHLAITYGAPGGWYYNESVAGFPELVPLSMFVATNQAFFMGMFFFISAFFIVPSLNRKGTGIFIKDRIIRLGIPTIIFYFLISPFTVFIRDRFIGGEDITYLQVLKNGWGMSFGPMWFVEALLLFSALYLLIRKLDIKIKLKFPGTGLILLSALLIGLGQFLIRIKMPVGTGHELTNFQWPFFIQYIFLFPLGIIAYQNHWMDAINSRLGKRWFIFAQILIFIGFPALFILGGAIESGTDNFMGGLTWQCFAYAIWEQLLGFSLILGLFGIFKKSFNSQGSFAKKLSDSAYGVYVFHTPVLLAISAVFLRFEVVQLFKFLILAPVSVLACFVIAWVVKKIPGVKKIL